MPSYTLPFAPSAGVPPVESIDDVRAAWPEEDRNTPPEEAPVREALTLAMLAEHLAYQDRAAYAAAQADTMRATSVYLDGLVDDRGAQRAPGESDEDLRARVFAPHDVATPTLLRDLATKMLAPYTSVKPQLFEGILDRLFIGDGSEPCSFIGAVDPEYPDRFYDERPQSSPGNCWLLDDMNGRLFVLRLPLIADLSADLAFLLDGSVDEAQPGACEGLFISDGSSDEVLALIFGDVTTPTAVYTGISHVVDELKGQGVRALLYTDPNLT
jgi:hypothetical protein